MPTPAGSSAIQSSVARIWPRYGPAALSLEGASGCLLNREAAPMAQLKALPDDRSCRRGRWVAVLRPRGGDGRRGRTRLRRYSDRHHPNRRVRQVPPHHLPRDKLAEGCRSWRVVAGKLGFHGQCPSLDRLG